MPEQKSPAPPRFGKVGLFSFVSWTLFTVGSIVLVFVRIFQDGSGPESTRQALTYSIGVAGCVVLVYGFMLLWRWGEVVRGRAIARDRPNAIVLSSGRTPELVTAFRELEGADRARLAVGFTLVVDEDGVQVWAGELRHPHRSWQIGWDRIESIRVGHVLELARTSNALRFGVRAGDRVVEVPFAITGRGLGGLFPRSIPELEKIAEHMEQHRTTARSNPPIEADAAVGEESAWQRTDQHGGPSGSRRGQRRSRY